MKKNAITADYVVSRQVLGLGINGKVVECFRKGNDKKYALKVMLCWCFVFNFRVLWSFIPL